jgi:hypothetical protein
MADRIYDTRTREEILAAAHFAPYVTVARINEIGLRELRTLDAFFVWTERQAVQVPSVEDFLAFTADIASTRRLENLRTAFDRIAPEGAAISQTVRAAIRKKNKRCRSCDRRPRDVIIAGAHFTPYRQITALAAVPVEDLRVLDRFLVFAEARRIEIPSVVDFLRFAGDVSSSRRLRSLKLALKTILPGNPAVLLTLQEAIRQKSPEKTERLPKPRPAARYRVPLSALPPEWQAALSAMRAGQEIGGLRPAAKSTLKNMEEVLREYARVMRDAGLPVTITIDGVRWLEAARTRRAQARRNKTYQEQGDRPATRHTAVQRIRAFAQHLGLDPLLISALQAHENSLRRDLRRVVPLKFAKLDRLPDLGETWALAIRLREESQHAPRRQTKLRLLNEATMIALWTLLPLRLADGQLRWGRDLSWTGQGYRVDIDTQKADVALSGRLHERLTAFLDALVLQGVDPAYLEVMRATALAEELPLFRDITGRMLALGQPSKVWAKHMGTGAHISRSRVHTELGRLGPEGITAALAINAQMDTRSAVFYQGQAVARARVARGQDMMEELLDAADVTEGIGQTKQQEWGSTRSRGVVSFSEPTPTPIKPRIETDRPA